MLGLEVRQLAVFVSWKERLRDRAAVARINVRISRLALGNFGDVRPIGEGVSELRINFGPGYRVYCTQRGDAVTLLCGGDKSSQESDIRRAKKLAKEI
ncbi:MAG TPA: type II toxin-antitoxin system RelE/ParE family toxin [Roseiarcus sp.]|nr:type II toxin-antitoxin system RelE/ParE family toxin [Roseiarcus sp.]